MIRRKTSSSSSLSTKKKPSLSAPKIQQDREQLLQEERRIRQLEESLRKREEAVRKKLENLPKELEEKQKKEQELKRLHLVAAPTRADGISRLRDKRHPHPITKKLNANTSSKRLAEQRATKIQFILLCSILLMILFLLWRSLPKT